jgi:putative restriction endonuclease
MAKNWDHAAGVVWPVLTDAAKNRKVITYGTIAPLIGTNPLNVGRALGPIQDFCLEDRLPKSFWPMKS